MAQDRPRNAFLQGLTPGSFATLARALKPAQLSSATSIFTPGSSPEWVYFPETSLFSMISDSGDGRRVETGLSGAESAAGLMEACGSGESNLECVVQVDGLAWRSPAPHCRKLSNTDADFARSAWRVVELQLSEARQSGLCQALHPVERRFARWMVESHERSGGRNPLPMTQEFLAGMLGVQRTTVSAFAAELQREGLIHYRRGQLELLNLPGLEERACPCRTAMREERTRLGLVPPPPD